ncbi:o-succinylbenzoate--CoA ligase [Weissella confusa]|uniref:o-succinylbenzoate--CoA ligase n=1 Tax=Weissella confusa TaxID=1583 RepID=UPI000704C270|nr:o-succinylbenzoate--CoA ligase [Weissella confusa]MBJ7628411.1 o-succinylbenzoate--CoA ligase [Weissella confusa]MBJ7698084.1 o-succinylbenzoate--CoA ligase [Weissella confusa]MBS7550197.1 o-succinylbenzoate--CoA ligase [Weissella confusa]MCQ8096035.1 o-succinylbenzoate--CoA ligase [Weissella confusa]MCQ8145465.1 o-succinylbenzoate--CoA ligase [Weissella confusa]
MENWLTKRAMLTPNRMAVRFEDTTLTFAEMRQRVLTIAGQITQHIDGNERIALITPNNLTGYLMILAIQQLGKTVVLLNRRLSPREMAFQLDDAEITTVIQDDRFVGELPAAKQVAFAEILATAAEAINPVADFDLDKVTSIMYTSGTTGNPKGVMQTFGNHFYSAVGSALNLGLTPDDVWLAAVPIFHISGLSIMMRSLIYGMGVSLYERFDVAKINAELMAGQVTTISVVPVMLKQLLAQLPEGAKYHDRFRTMLLGGGPTDLTTLEKATAAGIEIVQSYGMTETASQVIALDAASATQKLGSAGKPLFPVEVRIQKATDNDKVGRIQIKSPTLAVGYLNRPDKYAESFVDGWFDTGDMGWLDDDGFLYVEGREGDMISSGGENVFPDEIESVYGEATAIDQISVVGIPDERWGAVPVAFLSFKSGETMDFDSLRTFGRERLAHYKVPARFFVTDNFPRTASGKIQRHKLRDQLAEAREIK